jgi:positive regulator of sigma E activity
MSIKGKILKIDGELATLEVMFADTCKGCKGCVKAFMPDNKTYTGTAKITDPKLKEGDLVCLEPAHNINEATASLMLFGLPMGGFFVGLFVATLAAEATGMAFFMADFGKFLVGVGCSALFYLPAIAYSKRLQKQRLGLPEFIIVEESAE